MFEGSSADAGLWCWLGRQHARQLENAVVCLVAVSEADLVSRLPRGVLYFTEQVLSWGDISSGRLAGLQQKYTTRHGS